MDPMEEEARFIERTNRAAIEDLVTLPRESRQDAIRSLIRERVDPMDCVEITVTLKPSLQGAPDISIWHLVRESMSNIIYEEIFKHPKRTPTATLMHEYSKTGMFHFHGILSGCLKKTLNTIRKQFNHYVGRTEIKTITYFDSYIDYMTKDCLDLSYNEELNIFLF